MIETITALILLFCGIICTIKLKFYSPYRLLDAIAAPFKRRSNKTNGISPIKGLCTSLGGCIGTGNIIGVTACITIGGIGSIFWIWICAFFSLATKYLEVSLAVAAREKNKTGSPMLYITKFLGKPYEPLGIIWSILCLLSAICSGATVQANAISEAVINILPLGISAFNSRLICGIILAIFTFFILVGGLKSCSSISAILVPLMCIVYMTACITCIIISGKNIFSIIAAIVSDAINPTAACSGTATYIVLKSMRLGISRGIFSNEAGMGTSTLALSATSSQDPHAQGGMGIWEVIIDTFIICTVTAFLVITCVPKELLFDSTISPLAIIKYAFNTVMTDKISCIIITISTILFAFTSILGWSYYGFVCYEYIFNKNSAKSTIYYLVFCIMLIAGCIFPLGIIWDFASTFNMILALPNVFALIMIINKSKQTNAQLHLYKYSKKTDNNRSIL